MKDWRRRRRRTGPLLAWFNVSGKLVMQSKTHVECIGGNTDRPWQYVARSVLERTRDFEGEPVSAAR